MGLCLENRNPIKKIAHSENLKLEDLSGQPFHQKSVFDKSRPEPPLITPFSNWFMFYKDLSPVINTHCNAIGPTGATFCLVSCCTNYVPLSNRVLRLIDRGGRYNEHHTIDTHYTTVHFRSPTNPLMTSIVY